MERSAKKIELTNMIQKLCLLSTDCLLDENGDISEKILMKALELVQLLESKIEYYNKDDKALVYYLLGETINTLAKKKIRNSIFKDNKALYFYELAVKYYRESVKYSQNRAKKSLYMACYDLAEIQLSLGYNDAAIKNLTQCITCALSSAHSESREEFFQKARGFYWAGKGFEKLGGENVNTALNYYKKGSIFISCIESNAPEYYQLKKDLYYHIALLESRQNKKNIEYYLGVSINASCHLLSLRRSKELIYEIISMLAWYADICHEINDYKKEKSAIFLLIGLLSEAAHNAKNPDINISKIFYWVERLYMLQQKNNDKNAGETEELYYILRSYMRNSGRNKSMDW